MNYEMPDGRKILIGNERFRGPEILFQPSHCGKRDLGGIHEMLYEAIMRTDEDVQGEMTPILFFLVAILSSMDLLVVYGMNLKRCNALVAKTKSTLITNPHVSTQSGSVAQS